MSRYLEYVRIGEYGAFRNRSVGPFTQGLNVVFGPNEAGKSTVASFIGGVLFGWDESSKPRNAYVSQSGSRSGSLVFADSGQDPDLVIARGLEEDGAPGDMRAFGDIDAATYRTLFSLSSDELRSLRETSDVAARLLSAGSGTGSSPEAAFVEVEQRIAALTTRDKGAEGSIVDLERRMEEKREEVRKAREANDLLKLQDREHAELAQSRAKAQVRLAEFNDEVESLKTVRSRIDALDRQLDIRKTEYSSIMDERIESIQKLDDDSGVDDRLVSLDVATDRSVRDKLDELADEQAKAMRGVDIAKENSAASTAAYDALLEMSEDPANRTRTASARTPLIAASIIPPIIFVLLGVVVFLHGRDIYSLSFMSLGIGLVVLAFLLVAGAAAVLLRPNRPYEEAESRRKDAQWVMLQDKKKLESSLAAKSAIEETIREYFADHALDAANGSIRQARALLDDARVVRANRTAADQRISSLDMRLAQEEDAMESLEVERRILLSDAGLLADAPLAQIDARINAAQESRDAQAQACEEMNYRFGELTQLLDQACGDTAFDRLKFEYHEIACQLCEAKDELVVLLLAKRMLEQAMSAWESRNRPEVYDMASRLFSQATEGAWSRIAMTPEGRLVAIAPDGGLFDVDRLSLGTCQQLFLSLRIAMLTLADSVGRVVPVLADDILVHFDDSRRRAAARMLAELATKRQVVVFTCHRETVEALRQAVDDLNYIEL